MIGSSSYSIILDSPAKYLDISVTNNSSILSFIVLFGFCSTN
nr:MAG TPA: hypothetical protein [Crassvirales sp.]